MADGAEYVRILRKACEDVRLEVEALDKAVGKLRSMHASALDA